MNGFPGNTACDGRGRRKTRTWPITLAAVVAVAFAAPRAPAMDWLPPDLPPALEDQFEGQFEGQSVLLPTPPAAPDVADFYEPEPAEEPPVSLHHGCVHAADRPCPACAQPAPARAGRGATLLERLAARRACNDWCWTGRIEVLDIWRNAPSDRPIFSRTIAPTTAALGPTALNANQLISSPVAAPRVSLFRGDGCGEAVEATYIYAGTFSSERSLPYVPHGYAMSPPGIFGNLFGPTGDPTTDTSLNSATASLIGNFQSAEFNRRTAVGALPLQFLFGFRWLQWYERLQLSDTFSEVPPAPAPTIVGGDSSFSTCTNNLYGGQIGLDGTLLTTRYGFRVDGLVKAGAYYNASTVFSSFEYASSAPFAWSQQIEIVSPGSASFVGEVGLTGVMPLTSCWDFRVGYVGFWLQGLAQPTNQLSHQELTQFDPPSGTIDTTGLLVLQGLSLGLEGRW